MGVVRMKNFIKLALVIILIVSPVVVNITPVVANDYKGDEAYEEFGNYLEVSDDFEMTEGFESEDEATTFVRIIDVFECRVLAIVVARILGVGVYDDIDISVLHGMEFLISEVAVQSLSGVENLLSLQVLSLGYGDVSDLGPLANLTNLVRLDLWHNNVSNITPLSGLSSLRVLYLVSNNVSDVGPLASLYNLRDLRLQNNNISDIAPLASLINLLWLHVDNNCITDFSPLDDLVAAGLDLVGANAQDESCIVEPTDPTDPTDPTEPTDPTQDLTAAINALHVLIAEVYDLNETDFTSESWAVLEAALIAATAALDSDDIELVLTAAVMLQAAFDALAEVEPPLPPTPPDPDLIVALEALAELIAEINELDLDEENFTPESWAVLEAALLAANVALDSDDIEVALAATLLLQIAFDGLVEIEPPILPPTCPECENEYEECEC